MKAKKILTGALSLAMVLSLAACGGGSSATPTPGTEAPETTTPVTAAPEGEGSLQRVLDAGKLSIGAEGNWIPYVYNEDGTGELTGFEVEIAKEIASRLGVEAEFQISDSWDPVLAGLDAARYDIVICGVTPTPSARRNTPSPPPTRRTPTAWWSTATTMRSPPLRTSTASCASTLPPPPRARSPRASAPPLPTVI